MYTTQVLKRVEELIRNKDFPLALQELKNIDPSSLSRQEYGIYCLQMTEASLYVGDYSIDCIDTAIEIFRFDPDTEAFARAKFLKGWSFIAQGKHFEAKEPLLEAYTNYLRCNQLSGAARALNQLAFVFAHTGNPDAAISNLQNGIDLYERIGDHGKRLQVSQNLAFLISR
jgi:tetratricopeptide (TPR) repeat protein